jgi:hypothetical protein
MANSPSERVKSTGSADAVRVRMLQAELGELRKHIARIEGLYCTERDHKLAGATELAVIEHALDRLTLAVRQKYKLRHRQRRL